MNIFEKFKIKYFKSDRTNVEKKETRCSEQDVERVVDNKEGDELDVNFHYSLATKAYESGNYFLAYAQFKTTKFINDVFEKDSIKYHLEEIEKKQIDLLNIDHNQYYRFISMKNKLAEKANGEKFSVLDVGGGHGQFAHFLPNDTDYCLLEPSVNKISGLKIPFIEQSFDYVVSCHVLEHIDESEREEFLLQLLSKAKKGVLLLNPFYCPDIPDKEQLELLVDITKADWATEHLECGLPLLEDIQGFASKHGLNFEAEPNGTMATTTALVFTSFFAELHGEFESLRKVNRMFNRDFAKALDSQKYPTAYLVYLSRSTEVNESILKSNIC